VAAPGEIAIRRPQWRKSGYWPTLLAWGAVAAAVVILAGTSVLLLIHGEVSAETLGDEAYATVRGIVLVLGAMIFAGCASSLFIARTMHRRATAAINALVASGGDLPPDEVVCLYLRSFAASKAFARRRTWLSLGANVTIHDPETDLDGAVGDRCTLIAIGDRFDRRGALKISTSDERWIALFESVAARAALIFCFIGPTPASRLEIAHITASPQLFQKTVFIVPPETGKANFEIIRATAASLGITLPHHDARGFAVRPARGSRYMQIVPYAEMVATLKEVDLRAPALITEIWRKSPFFGLDRPDGVPPA
jgi:hypothetical protein